MLGMQTYQGMILGCATEWIRQAETSQCFNRAFQLAEAAVRGSLAQLGLLRAAKALPRDLLIDAGLDETALGEVLRVVLEQVRAVR